MAHYMSNHIAVAYGDIFGEMVALSQDARLPGPHPLICKRRAASNGVHVPPGRDHAAQVA